MQLLDPGFGFVQGGLEELLAFVWEVHGGKGTHGLRYIVDYYGTIRIPVVHRSERLISFLASCIPYLELDGCCVVQGNGLCKEGGANG